MSSVIGQPQLLYPVSSKSLDKPQFHLPVLKLFSFKGPETVDSVASSLASLIRQLDTKVEWITLYGVPSQEDNPIPGLYFPNLDISKETVIRNEQFVLNYLCRFFHGMTEKISFNQQDWKNFQLLSINLAHQSQRIASQSFPTLIWLHDFEMVLLAPMLACDAGVILAHFWHVPWPKPEIIAGSPVGLQLTEALLSNKILGFQTNPHAGNFIQTVKLMLPEAKVDESTQQIKFRGLLCQVVAMPMGLDYQYWQKIATNTFKNATGTPDAISTAHKLASKVVLGVDRYDFTKGLLEKLTGIEQFLIENPAYYKQVHFVQLVQSARVNTSLLTDYAELVRAKVQALNERFKKDTWEPIIWQEGNLSQAQLAAWYQVADVLYITPVQESVNLIAKEYVACRLDEQGVLILSDQTGSAYELGSGAMLVNPTLPGHLASALKEALSMGLEEQRQRMASMRQSVSKNLLHTWAYDFLKQSLYEKKDK